MAQQIAARKQQELQNQYTNYKNGLQQIASKIGDVETEAEEHKLVLETLEPLSGDRKCFRMINGVLVERTVKDVVPALKTNSEGLRKVLEDLVKQYNSKQSEMEKWKKKNNIQVAVNKEGRNCLAILLHNGEVNMTYAGKHSCPRSRLVRIILPTELP
ncbi:hypothetical protein EYC80_005980 [Monilinia laxa]|uniref:Prefoldin subunit 2 n=1 Tax=Monilinia laxa TaxID=61186 RepID=A0A5N6KG29_MONLA|nr:hypothetical protein EYC80_005980 [Monilinia laxa]